MLLYQIVNIKKHYFEVDVKEFGSHISFIPNKRNLEQPT